VLVRAGALAPSGTGPARGYDLLELGEVAGAVRARNELWIAAAVLQIDAAQQPAGGAIEAAAGEGAGTGGKPLPRLSPAQLAAVLGGLITNETVDRGTMWSAYEPSLAVEECLANLEPTREALQDLQGSVWPPVEAPLRVDTRLAGLVEAWASGVAWDQVVRDSSIDEGDMARLLLRTADVLRQVATSLPHVSALTQHCARDALKSVDRAPISELVQ